MLTRQRIREILQEYGLSVSQLSDVAAYFDTVQTELTEQDVRDFAEILVNKGVANVKEES